MNAGDGRGDAILREAEVLVAAALSEDVGEGDWTTLWTVDAGLRSEGWIVAKESLTLAGIWIAESVFHAVDPTLEITALAEDGARIEAGAEFLRVHGSTRSILTAERVALNFLGRLSGIATLARRFVDEVRGTEARVTDTRKTTPGWRHLEKWAVRMGGVTNHRMGLYDMVLVKDNHIAAAGGLGHAVERVRAENDRGLEVEVEIVRPEQADELRGLGVERILLDNMDEPQLRAAVSSVGSWASPRPELEASGNMTLDRVRRVAETGVDWISVGALTHSARTADVSLSISTPTSSVSTPPVATSGDR